MQKMGLSAGAKRNRYLIKVRRNMPIEIFNLMKIFIKDNCIQPREKETQSTITLRLSSDICYKDSPLQSNLYIIYVNIFYVMHSCITSNCKK